MVASHAPAFVAHKAPYGQHACDVLLLVTNHRLHHVCIATGLEQSEEGVLGPVGVPNGKNGIVIERVGMVYLAINTPILSVYVHIDGGIYHGMIKRSVEHGLLVVGAFAADHRELSFPL